MAPTRCALAHALAPTCPNALLRSGLLTPKHVKVLGSVADAKALVKAPGTKVVLVTDKAKVSDLYKSLSQRFSAQFMFAQASRWGVAAACQRMCVCVCVEGGRVCPR